MKWWSRFWRRRRQDDRVKVISLFAAAAVFFFGNAVYTGTRLYQTVGERGEYVLRQQTETGFSDMQISEIENMEGVLCVSRQRETPVSLKAGETEVSFSCLELSAEYMKIIYKAAASGAMKQFYLNKAACEQLLEAEGLAEFEESQMDYSITDESGVQENGVAVLALLEGNVGPETPYIFCVSDSARLVETPYTIRVVTQDQDLDGQQLSRFQKMGFEVVNESERKQEMLRQEMELLRIKYQMITAVVCVTAAAALRKF